MTSSAFRDLSGLNRRSLLKSGLVALGAGIAAPSILRAQTSSLTVPNPGGALEEALRAAYFTPFTAETGIAINPAPYMDAARIRAMVENNAVDVDVVITDMVDAATLARLGLLEKIDTSIVDTSKLIPAAVNEHYLLSDVAAYAMCWNTDAVKQGPASWAEYFDTAAFPGLRSFWQNAAQTLDVAAIAGGQPLDGLYPLDVDLAFAMLDKLRKDIVWWTSGAQSAQLLIDGETDLGTAWNGRVYKPKVDGAKIDYTYAQSLFTSDAIIVPKGAKNVEASMRFVAAVMDAKNQAVFATAIPYGPTNSDAFAHMTEEARNLLPNAPGKSTGVFQSADFWAANGQEITQKFNDWLAA